MNEELQKQLAVIIAKSIELAEKTGEFVIEQGNDLIKEFFMWHTASSIFWMALTVIMTIAWRASIKACGKKEDPTFCRDDCFKMFGTWHYENSPVWILIIVPPVVILPIFFINAYDLLMIMVAPKLYLIQELKYLI